MADETHDRGPEFDGVKIGRPATGALIDAGYRRLSDLPVELDELLDLHGVGPSAVRRLQADRHDRGARASRTMTTRKRSSRSCR